MASLIGHASRGAAMDAALKVLVNFIKSLPFYAHAVIGRTRHAMDGYGRCN